MTKETPVYPRICGKGNYHYETIRVNVQYNAFYTFETKSTIVLYGIMYENTFDPLYPNKNLLAQSNFTCDRYRFLPASYLEINKRYVLVVTTFDPSVRGSFTLLITGPNNITLNRISK